jgi:hypothetical protein
VRHTAEALSRCLLLLAFALAQSSLCAPPPNLAIVNITLHQYEGGPVLPASHTFVPGETVFFAFQVSGFRASEKDEIRLSYRVETLDGKSILLAEPIRGKIEVELTPQDKSWLPKARHEVTVPPFAGAGSYRILISVKDEIAGTEAKKEASFRVLGRDIPYSDKLEVRNFHFLRSEDDTQPLPVAAYRPADVVWARFEMLGYKIGEKNHFHVTYGLSVLNPSGRVLFTQPQAAEEEKSPFYPQRWAPGMLSLTGRSDTKPGEYTIVLTVHDLEGNQTIESRHSFHVE